jgi:hypothetical protein
MAAAGSDLLHAAALLALGRGGDPWALTRARTATGAAPALTAAALALAPLWERDAERCAAFVVPYLFSEAHASPSGAPSLAHVAASALTRCAGRPVSLELPTERGWSPHARFVASLGGAPATDAALTALQRFRGVIATAAAAAAATPEGQRRLRQMLLRPESLPPLVERASPEALAEARAEILGAAAPSLAAAYRTLDDADRRATLRLLAAGGDAARRTAAGLLLEERDSGVIEDALDAMPDAGAELEPLAFGEDHPWSLRLAAVRAVARGASTSRVEVLSRALRSDPSAWVREAAALGLRRRADPAAQSALRAAREDPDPAVRDAARDDAAP